MLKLETISCPYCQGVQSDLWGEENGYAAVQCRSCGLVFVNPRPTLAAIDEAVRLGMHPTEQGTLDVNWFSERQSQQQVRGMTARLLKLFSREQLTREPLRWLDVGAGYGELLLALAGIAGQQAGLIGVEPSLPKRDKAREMGVQMVESVMDVDGAFDYLSLINVFSHLPDPAGFLADITGRLAPRGELLLVTGNGGDVRRSDYPDPLYLPDHLIFAGEKHVSGILERAGFEIVQIKRYRQFLPEKRRTLRSIMVNMTKHSAKRLLGRPSSYHLIRHRGPFRSLWIRTRRQA
jgi:SAM-dependent methyltransferase